MKKLLALGLIALLVFPSYGFAAGEEATIKQLQEQIQKLSAQLEALAKQVEANKVTAQSAPPVPAAPAAQAGDEEIKELAKRLDKVERHTVLDRVEFSGDMRYRYHSLHYNDVTYNPGIQVNFTDFFNKAGSWMMDNPAGSQAALNTLFSNLAANDPEMFTMLNTMMLNYMSDPVNNAPGVGAFRFIPSPKTYDINNDVLQTTRFRLNMKAKVWDNVKFSGRLSMFKNWGDSTGSQVFDSWNRFTMDATNGANTTDDTIRLDRAYFDWSDIGESGFYLSIGRRPSTGGPPLHYRENELRGGTPTGNVMSLNFDGITVGRNLEDLTGIEGMVARFCYGQGFESEWGNGEMFNEIVTKDTHFAGINMDILNDGTNFLQFTAFRAMDINDGFKGVIAFPTQYGAIFAPTLYSDMQKFPNFNFVTRVQPSTTIGDIDLAGLVFSREEENGVNWFVSGGMTVLRPNGKAGMFGGMGSDAIFEAELNSTGTEVIMVPKTATNADDEEGYGFYAGIQIPAPLGKLGLEYNYGSEWWTPFNQAIDDAAGSKLATRGHAGEAYYIFDINPNMFIKLSGIYYDFEYSGSGSPVGKPQKIEDVEDGKAYSLLPVVDTAYDLNASLTIKF